MARNIAQDTLAVGNALTSVRIDNMILNLAKGIAWGQYELDKVGVDITKMMGAPGTVAIGGEQLSMLEAGFIPSFYHFVDTILELKMEVNIREETSTSLGTKSATSGSSEFGTSGEVSMKSKASGGVNAGAFNASSSFEVGMKAGWSSKSTAAYSSSVDASHAQKFSQDLSASSLMRTKLVPVPPPELLVERIKIMLEKLRKEAEEGEEKSEAKALENLGEPLFSISGLTDFTEMSLDNPDDVLVDTIYEKFKQETDYLLLKKMTISQKSGSEGIADGKSIKKWIVKDRAENKYILTCEYIEASEGVDYKAPERIDVYSGGQSQKDLFDFGELLDMPV